MMFKKYIFSVPHHSVKQFLHVQVKLYHYLDFLSSLQSDTFDTCGLKGVIFSRHSRAALVLAVD